MTGEGATTGHDVLARMREGVGRALVAAVCGWAEELGRTRVTLSVLDGNPAAEALYRRCGFRVVESRAVEVAGEARTETHMERAV